MQKKKLSRIINRFPAASVLVIGDIILDEYIWGQVERISPEAPVPVVWANKSTYVPGGAANVAYNIKAMGADVCVAGVAGKDENARVLFSELRKRRIPAYGILADTQRHTTVKTRIIAGHQQVVRVDWEHTHPLTETLNKKLIDFVRRNIAKFDAVIIEDYGKGVINMRLLEEVISLAVAQNKIITVDPKQEHFQYYRGVTAITPNRKELENAIRDLRVRDKTNSFQVHDDKLFSDKDIGLAAGQIIKYLGLESILVTLGEGGMRLFEAGRKGMHIPTVAQEVFDVSGAGDTVISVFTLALCCGATKTEAAHIANFAAGIVVGKVGTAVTDRNELLKRVSIK